MADIRTIQDYGLIDDFILQSLNTYNKRAFGRYDDNTGYFEETDQDDNEETVQNEQDVEQNDEEASLDDIYEEDVYDALFSGEYDVNNLNDYSPKNNLTGMNNPMPGNSMSGNSRSRGFRTFGNYQEGKNALINQLKLYQTGKTKTGVKPYYTLNQAMAVYAPKADRNNPEAYAKYIANRLGISVNTPISEIDTKAWAGAIEKMEGNKQGNNPGNLRYQAGGTIPNAGSVYDLLGETETAKFSLEAAKNLKISKDGKFKGLIPLDSWTDDMMNFVDKIKFVTKNKEKFVKVRGKLFQFQENQDEPVEFKPKYRIDTLKMGGVPIGRTKRQQYIGLNDESLESLMLPLSGNNIIRGLDSGEPIVVYDESGDQTVLQGPNDRMLSKGKVYEKRLK